MSDYIKREDAEKSIDIALERFIVANFLPDRLHNQIGAIPSADVELVRHATCKEYEDSYSARCVCSECGCNFEYPRRGKPNYCPNCGAKMDGESDE